ncbi:MAG: SdrD B-like domain-containing protein [bacterium]|nr:SdrD B-like domain-containing protein [bacterium]
MFAKRSFTFLVIISLLSVNFLPIFTPRAEAQFGGIVHDPIIGALVAAEKVYKLAKDKLDSVAMIAARLAIQQIVNSTVRWAQSGFDGNPAYMTDPRQYFTDMGDGIAGDFIGGPKSPLNFLCSPFQTQIRLSLRNQYLQDNQFQCTLTDVVANIDAFYNDFSQGGWDGWFAMTQNSSNNPYGAYLDAQIELDSRIASAAGLKQDQLNRSSGFLSWEECKPEYILTQQDIDNSYGEYYDNNKGRYYQAGDCYDDGSGSSKTTVTPGPIIKSGLDKVLPSGLESLITVNHIEQLIEAFATGVLNKYVFGSQGLFGKGPGLPTDRPKGGPAGGDPGSGVVGVDIDGDGLNDIIDSDGDGNIDNCLYDGEYPSCKGSKEAAANSSTIWGYIFEDTNRNGTQDSGESRPSGITVRIKSADGETELGTSQTYNGLYSFANLANGQTYKAEVIVPSGYVTTSPNDVSVTANPLVPNQPVKNFGIAPEQ